MARAGGLAFWPSNQPPRVVLVSDLDHTMVQNDDPSHRHLLRFNALWQCRMAHDSLLVYSTGRSPLLYRKLWEEAPLLTPSVLICSVGSEIFHLDPDGSAAPDGSAGSSGGGGGAAFRPDPSWERLLDEGWQRSKVQQIAAGFPHLQPQVESEQRRHKLSYHLQTKGKEAEELLHQLRGALAGAGLKAKVVYSGGMDVDILAEGAGKGRALEFLLNSLKAAGLEPQLGVQVNGDSGNDVELFQVPGVKGCVVANAHPELRAFADNNPSPSLYQATLACAGGIIQALTHFGFARPTSSSSPGNGRQPAAEARAAAFELVLHASRPLEAAGAPAVASGAEAGHHGTANGAAGHTSAAAGLGDDGGPAALDAGHTARETPYGCAAADDAGAALDRATLELMDAAAASALWLDRLELALVRGTAQEPQEYTATCQVFRLAPGGGRDVGSMTGCSLAVTAHNDDGARPEGESSGSGGGGGGGGAGFVAEMRSGKLLGMQDVVLPPANSSLEWGGGARDAQPR